MEAVVYNQDGKKANKISLPESLFNLPWNPDLVHQVVTVMAANNRQNPAYVRDRSEVRGGGAKPWRQKGTGRARHGSSRSPIWSGGGVTHGPTLLRDYSRNLSKKMRSKAFFVLLSRKFKDNEVAFAQLPDLTVLKTKIAQNFIDRLAALPEFKGLDYRQGNRALIVTAGKNEGALKSFGNIPQVAVANASDVSPLEIINYKFVIFTEPEATLELLRSRVHFTKLPAETETNKPGRKKPSTKKVAVAATK